jgi:hypothetical protein
VGSSRCVPGLALFLSRSIGCSRSLLLSFAFSFSFALDFARVLSLGLALARSRSLSIYLSLSSSLALARWLAFALSGVSLLLSSPPPSSVPVPWCVCVCLSLPPFLAPTVPSSFPLSINRVPSPHTYTHTVTHKGDTQTHVTHAHKRSPFSNTRATHTRTHIQRRSLAQINDKV